MKGQNSGFSVMNNLRNRGVARHPDPPFVDGLKAFQMPSMPHSLRPQSKPALSTSCAIPELLRMERSQERRKRPQADLSSHG